MAAKCLLFKELINHAWINIFDVFNLKPDQFILESLALVLDLCEHTANLINDFDHEERNDAFLYVCGPDVCSFSLDSFHELFKGVKKVLRGLAVELAKEIINYS